MAKLQILIWTLGVAMTCAPSSRQPAKEETMQSENRQAIEQLIETAYIDGVHTQRSLELASRGFDRTNFRMAVRVDDEVQLLSLEQWLFRVEELAADDPDTWSAATRWELESLDVSGKAAVAKLRVYKGDVFFSTDYMMLYKMERGWRIVSKIFDTNAP